MKQKNAKFIALALSVFMKQNSFSYHDIMRGLVVLGNEPRAEIKNIPDVKISPQLDLEQVCTT